MTKELSKECFNRDGWRCRHCHTSHGLHPHHIVYRSHGGKDEIDNLVTLCWLCHQEIHHGKLLMNVERNPEGEIVLVAFHWKNE